MTNPINKLTGDSMTTDQTSLYKRAPLYAYISWYILLFSWVQGIAALHITLAICTLLSLTLLPQAISKLKNIPWLWIPVVAYEVVRVISSIISEHPNEAFIGIFDDARAIIFGLVTLVFINNKKDLEHAAWVTFAGFSCLAYWTLGYHLFTHHFSLNATTDIILGSLGSVNYAAAITTIAMLSMLTAAILLPWKSARWMFIGIIPLIILQIPLGSRTTILVTIILLFALIVFLRAWKASILIVSLTATIIAGLALTPTGLSQFSSLSHSKEQLNGQGSMPSIQIRWEIFQVLSHLSLQHVLGLGPRNHGFADLNSEREFLRTHAKTTSKYIYGITTDSEAFERFDFNHVNQRFTADPHSQYTAVISETGPIGFILLLLIYTGIVRYSSPLIKSSSPNSDKILGMAGMLMLSIFLLSGLTVVLIYQAGSLMLLGYAAALASFRQINHKDALDTTSPHV